MGAQPNIFLAPLTNVITGTYVGVGNLADEHWLDIDSMANGWQLSGCNVPNTNIYEEIKINQGAIFLQLLCRDCRYLRISQH